MKITLIAAMTKTGVIGNQGKLPWHLPEDLAFFKKVTFNKPVIMGRKTFESIGKPLAGRDNIILTRNKAYQAEGCQVVYTKEEALIAAKDFEEVMVIGGRDIYALFLPDANQLILSIVDEIFQGDTYFPDFNRSQWQVIAEEKRKGFTVEFLKK